MTEEYIVYRAYSYISSNCTSNKVREYCSRKQKLHAKPFSKGTGIITDVFSIKKKCPGAISFSSPGTFSEMETQFSE